MTPGPDNVGVPAVQPGPTTAPAEQTTEDAEEAAQMACHSHPDRPPPHESSPFTWVWDDQVPRPDGTGYALYQENGANLYNLRIPTNRGYVSILVWDSGPPAWLPFPSAYPCESDLLQCAIARRASALAAQGNASGPAA